MALFLHVLAILAFIITNLGVYAAECSSKSSYLTLGPSASPYIVDCLPDVNFSLPASWAGQISIPGSTDDELFFWLFEAEGEAQSENLIIWLNGGPGCSSLDGLTKENGPLRFCANASTPAPNPYSWTKSANVLYIDQPVGTGYSGGSDPPTINAQVTQEFGSWLKAFYGSFPSLISKKTYIMGESYAGIYIPYFTQAVLANKKDLPINLKGIAFGDATFGNFAALTDVVATSYIKQQSNILQVSNDILETFEAADERCGFSGVEAQVTYPPQGPISIPGDPEGENFRLKKRQTSNTDGCITNPNVPALVNQSINLCNGGCATFTTGLDYLNSTRPCFSPYNIAYDCTNAPDTTAFVNYLNLPTVREAIHAPNKLYADCNSTIQEILSQEYVEPPAYSIMLAILEAGVPIHIYAGDNDYFLNHLGARLAIQNMTWKGLQGLQEEPGQPFLVNGTIMGNWGSERNLSYHHILDAGHAVPYDQPAAAFAFVKDFVVGSAGYSQEHVS